MRSRESAWHIGNDKIDRRSFAFRDFHQKELLKLFRKHAKIELDQIAVKSTREKTKI